MDRFKFRVWNKNTHSFTIGGAIKFGGLCFVDREDFGIKLGEHQECYIIEQCTGMKDKNGNLIYEGDIVKAVTDTYKVIWDRHRWAIKSSQGYIFSEYINDLLYDCEIIGNIHETKGE